MNGGVMEMLVWNKGQNQTENPTDHGIGWAEV